MEAVGQLAGGVAHDFNNLLQVIQGFSSLALADLPPGSEAYESLEHVLQAAERATLLVRQLLAFGRRQALNMTLVDLNQVIDELTTMLRPLLGEHVTIEARLALDLAKIHADCNQIEQILINLCVNARDAMPAGGALKIRTRNVEVDAQRATELGLPAPGPHVLLEVADSGCGMDQETRARVFEPFFTTKQPGKGTGLGLATVHGLVGQHRGAIQLCSAVGQGTTASVYLPVATAAMVASEPRSRPRPARGSETLLLAEDDRNVRKLTRTLLEAAGYTVLVAADGEEARQLIVERGDEIDLAVLDVVMPKRGGELVFRDLRERRPNVPVLFASAYEPAFQRDDQPPPARVDSIQKPFTREELLRKVRSALDDAS